MMDEYNEFGGHHPEGGGVIEIDLNFESMRRFQAEFSPNLGADGLFIDTGEPLNAGSVVRFRVILPEDFVFLEGTSVVEWTQSAETVSDTPPGMALRFVTLSPQNQELVAQLVQDHLRAGGTPFDIDYRPVPTDFPTDALEGAPPPTVQPSDEGYRLTFRRTEPNLEADALRALAEASPVFVEDVISETVEAAAVEPAEPGEFEIVSRFPVNDRREAVVEEVGAEAVAEEGAEEAAGKLADDLVEDTTDELAEDIADRVDEPPQLDWSVWKDDPVEPYEDPVEALASEPEIAEDVIEDVVEASAPEESDFLPAPADFEDGPEVLEDVGHENFGGQAFDVSLPEIDDEPDTTPVLPDEGRDDVTVTPEEDEEGPAGRRRRWPLALAAVIVLAMAAGFLWPYVQTRLAVQNNDQVSDPMAMVAEVAGGAGVPDVPGPVEGSTESRDVSPEAPVESTIEPAEEEAPAQATVTGAHDEVDEAVDQVPAGNAEPEEAPATIRLAAADAVTSIAVEPGARGTVITIRGNGSLAEGTISMENLPSPPRLLVRVRGIRSDYRPYVIESATPEVTRVRIGLHDERRPPELWVVIDLADAELAVHGIDLQGATASIEIARR